MRILFLTHYFQPEPNFFMGLPFAKELVRRGHQVQVLTGFPNYPGGKIYEGYKVNLFQKENMDGIPVVRLPLYPSHDHSSFKRILCYSTLSLSQSMIAPFVIKSADVAYVVQGPATLGLPATVLKWLRGIPFVYNIQDLWPDSLLSTEMFNSNLGLKMLHGWCNFIYRRAAKIVVIAQGMKKKLIERGVPGDKIEVIYNWCDGQLICREDRDENLARQLGFAGKFSVVFAGNMGKAQALDAVIEAAGLLKSDFPNIQFVFIGSGVDVDKLKSVSQKKQLNNVLFLPRRPVSEIGPVLRLADVLLVHLRKDPLFSITIPSKTQAYLAMGRPLLMAAEGDASELVNRAQAGLSCEPENPRAIAAAVKQLYDMTPSQLQRLGENGQSFYDRELSFSVAVDRYEQLFKTVIK
jgi:glycosyltransferase involved in cell wall biosynthesis